jgi:hypothetical protein
MVDVQFEDLKIRRIISSCLSGMIILLLMMFISDYIRLGISGDFSSLKTDPGIPGLWILTTMVCLNLFIQVLVQISKAKPAKIFITGFAGIYGLFFLGHQLVHYQSDGFKFDVHILLDTSNHVFSLIAFFYGLKWIKISK